MLTSSPEIRLRRHQLPRQCISVQVLDQSSGQHQLDSTTHEDITDSMLSFVNATDSRSRQIVGDSSFHSFHRTRESIRAQVRGACTMRHRSDKYPNSGVKEL